jgi:hypothetical protein
MMHAAMDRRAPLEAAQGSGSDRREEPLLRFALDPAPGRLREVLRELDWELVDLEPRSVERVRLALSEVLTRSTGNGDHIVIEIFVLSETIRIELSGPALALPEDLAQPRDDGATFPSWLLSQLADGWGVDRRRSERGIWLLLER